MYVIKMASPVRSMGRGHRRAALGQCPQGLPFTVDPDHALDLSTEGGLLLQGDSNTPFLDPFAIAVHGLVAEITTVERMVELEGQEILARGSRVATAQVHGCFLAALDRSDDALDEPFVEEVLQLFGDGQRSAPYPVVAHGGARPGGSGRAAEGAARRRVRKDAACGRSRGPRSQPWLITPSGRGDADEASRRCSFAEDSSPGASFRVHRAMSVTATRVRPWRRRARSGRAANADSRCRNGLAGVRAAARGAPSTRSTPTGGGNGATGSPSVPLDAVAVEAGRVDTGIAGLDRVLGGGLVPGSVVLLSGEPGIGKSTLLLQLVASLGAAGRSCLLVSGEESHAQIAARAQRLGITADSVSFAPGRELEGVLQVAAAERPFLLAVDSIQTLRDAGGSQMPGGVSQVRTCTDALVGMAKSQGVAVILTGHVTKDGDLAGPKTLEHAVDVVLAFDGDARSGLRVLAAAKNRFGPEGESAWFEMGPAGLTQIDPTIAPGLGRARAGCRDGAASSGQAGARGRGPGVGGLGRRSGSSSDHRHRWPPLPAGGSGARSSDRDRRWAGPSSSGPPPAVFASTIRHAILRSRQRWPRPPRVRCLPQAAAFVGEVSLTGLVRSAPGMGPRLAAAEAAGCSIVFAPGGDGVPTQGLRVHAVRHLREAIEWAKPTPSA